MNTPLLLCERIHPGKENITFWKKKTLVWVMEENDLTKLNYVTDKAQECGKS